MGSTIPLASRLTGSQQLPLKAVIASFLILRIGKADARNQGEALRAAPP